MQKQKFLANLDDLMDLAGSSIHDALEETIKRSKDELSLLNIELDVDGLKPANHVRITYDEAIKIANIKGSKIEYGQGLARREEIILSEYVGNKYLWVQCPPFTSEGFPYKRKPGQMHLSMTADLIAPHGAGEMVGVAEKTTSADELVQNLIDKGRRESIPDYWDYILLRQYGLPPHGGIGAAPERIIYGLLNLDHIRLTKPWPRYPDRKIAQKLPLNPWNDSTVSNLIKKFNLKYQEADYQI